MTRDYPEVVMLWDGGGTSTGTWIHPSLLLGSARRVDGVCAFPEYVSSATNNRDGGLSVLTTPFGAVAPAWRTLASVEDSEGSRRHAT